MAGFYTTYKVFTPGEILTASDLNASEQQHVTYQQATVTEGYSRSLQESRVQAGSSTLAITVADEFARIREKIRLLGVKTYWDEVTGPASMFNLAMPKAQILLPLEGALTPGNQPDIAGGADPTAVVRTSLQPPPGAGPKIVDTMYEFHPTTPQSLLWKITTPLGYKPGGLIELICKVSIKENITTGNFRVVAGIAPVYDESTGVGHQVLNAAVQGADNIPVPAVWTTQKEVRVPLTTTGILENQTCVVVITFWPAATSNCAGIRILNSCSLEFTRGNFVVPDPGMANPMTTAGDMIVGWTSGTPIRLAAGIESQTLSIVGGLPSWQNPPAGMQNPMVANADLIVGGTSGIPQRFPVGANGNVLAVSGGSLIWQSPTTSVTPNVNYIDFTAGVALPLPPPSHAYLGVENVLGVPNLVLAGPLGGKMRIGGLGGPWTGITFITDTGVSLMEFVTDNGETWIGSDQVHKTHLYTGSTVAPYFATNVSLRPDGHVEFGAGGIFLRQLPTMPTGEATYTSFYARNDRRLYYTDEFNVERPLDPITTRGDLVVGDSAGVAVRLPKGASGKILTVSGLDVVWGDPVAAGNPLTATGDMIYASAGGVQQRLAVGATGRVLTVLGGLPSWELTQGMVNPMTQLGDIVYGGTSGTPTRLAIGAESRVLTISGGLPTWQVPSGGLTNPMTAQGDLIRGGTAGDPTRLPAGTNGFYLSMVGGIPTWASVPGFANPMTTAGDIIIGGASGTPTRSGIGTAGHVLTVVGTTPTWAAPSGGMTNPMTAAQDLIVGGASGTPTRFPVGTNTHVLTVVGGVLTWQAPTSGGMTNPMTTLGDIITGAASGVAQRIGVGSNTQVLTVVGGVPAWAAPTSGGMTNPMTTSGDIIIGGASGAANRLAKGTDGHLLTLAAGLPSWAANAAMLNPMTTPGDMIRATTAGAAQRFAVGSNNQILKVTAGVPGWAAETGFANPMTTLGDIMTGGASGAPGRLGIGTTNQVLTVVGGIPAWAAASGLTNPMTTVEDIIKGGASGVPARLARGTNGQYLGVSSNTVQYLTPPFLTSPMTSTGDIIVGGASGVAARLGIGSTNQVLTVIAGTPSWVTQTALTNPMTTTGDMIYASGGSTPTRLAAVATGRVLASAGTSTAPAWSQNLVLGNGAVGTSGAVVAALGGGTTPTTSPADTVQMWSADNYQTLAGSRGLMIRDESGYTARIGDGVFYLKAWSADPFKPPDALVPDAGHGMMYTDGMYWYSKNSSGTIDYFVMGGDVPTNHVAYGSVGGLLGTADLQFDPSSSSLVVYGPSSKYVQMHGDNGSINIYDPGGSLNMYSNDGAGNASINMNVTPSGGHAVNMSALANGAFGFYDGTVPSYLIHWDASGNAYLRVVGATHRILNVGAADSGGAGWRHLLIAN